MAGSFFKYRFLWIGLLGALLSCNPSKQLVTDGDKLAEEGKYEDATSYYYSALVRKPAYKPAKDGLKISAQKVLDDKFNKFRRLVLDNKIEEAVKQYRYAEEFSANAKRVGVELDWAHEYDEVYEDVKREYTGILFDAAIVLMNNKKFDLAEKKFQEIGAIDSNYRNVSVLRQHTVLDPLYADAMRLLQEQKYQAAYETFVKITNLDDDYKDAAKRKEEALAKATNRIGVLPVLADAGINRDMVNYELEQRLKNSTFAFIRIVDHTAMEQMLSSRGWGVVSLEQAVQSGKSLGLQYVLFAKITLVSDTFVPTTSETRIAYEAYTENIPNPYTDTYSYITKFKKVSYQDVYEARQIIYQVNVSLVSCTDGKVLFNDEFEAAKSDELHKFDYKGNVTNLYESLPQGNFLPPSDNAWREQFIGSKRTLLDKKVLETELAKEIAQRIAFSFNKSL